MIKKNYKNYPLSGLTATFPPYEAERVRGRYAKFFSSPTFTGERRPTGQREGFPVPLLRKRGLWWVSKLPAKLPSIPALSPVNRGKGKMTPQIFMPGYRGGRFF